MPIFGRIVNSRLKRVSKSSAMVVSNTGKTLSRAKAHSQAWGEKSTPFSRVNSSTLGELSKTLRHFLALKGEVSVLDWGCYKGTSARYLAKDPRVQVFGFTRDAHPIFLNRSNLSLDS